MKGPSSEMTVLESATKSNWVFNPYLLKHIQVGKCGCGFSQ